MASTEIKRTACPHDCPDTCALLAHVQDGRLVKLEGNPDHPVTRGHVCAKVNHYLERVHNPNRILKPMKRVGPKGEARFAEISWDEALDTVAARFKEIIATDGPEAILPYSYAGTMGFLNRMAMPQRFWNTMGASRLARTICSSAGGAGYAYTLGRSLGTDPEDFPKSKLIIIWGSNSAATGMHVFGLIKEAQRNGATLVVIDPHRNTTARQADIFIQPRPGTDAALALALMHVLIEEDLYDKQFVAEATVGFEQLRKRAKECTPEWAESITGVSAGQIRDLARMYARTRPAAIRAGLGINRHTNGGMTIRTIACLPALIGSWKEVGGGMLLSLGVFPLNTRLMDRDDLLKGKPRTIDMNQLGGALLGAKPPVRALCVYSCNPAAVTPDQSKVLEGLRREDLFTVVHEQTMTDTARYADILLPSTTFVEQNDFYRAYGHMSLLLGDKAIEPLGEAKSLVDLFRLLAKRMGYDDPCFDDTEDDMIRQGLTSDDPYMQGITLERLREEGFLRPNVGPRPFLPFAKGVFPTPSGKVEYYSEKMLADGYDPLPAYEPAAESFDGSPELHARYPLNLLTTPTPYFLNSSFAEVPAMIAREGRAKVQISAKDASARGVADGDLVRVFNDRGSCSLYAEVSDNVRPGVAVAPSVWWNENSPGRTNSNQTTSQRLTDIGKGATFYTNLVQIEKA